MEQMGRHGDHVFHTCSNIVFIFQRSAVVASPAGCRFMQVTFTCNTKCHITASLVTMVLLWWMHVASSVIPTPLTMFTFFWEAESCSSSKRHNIVCIMPGSTATCRTYRTLPRVRRLLQHFALQRSSTAVSPVHYTNIVFLLMQSVRPHHVGQSS